MPRSAIARKYEPFLYKWVTDACVIRPLGNGWRCDACLFDRAQSAEALHTGPTLLVYQLALARSPEDLDTLLDEDAVVPRGPVPAPTRVCDFTRSVASLDALLGGY